MIVSRFLMLSLTWRKFSSGHNNEGCLHGCEFLTTVTITVLGLQMHPEPPRAALASISARGKEVGHVGLVQLGCPLKGIHKELDNR